MSTNYSHIALPEPCRISERDIELFEALNRARILSNALEHHADQSRTYGKASDALVEALTWAHVGTPLDVDHDAWKRARAWAEAVVGETIDNGESIAYSTDVVASWRTFNPGDQARIVETGRAVTVMAHDSLDVVIVKGHGQHDTFPVAISDLVSVRS